MKKTLLALLAPGLVLFAGCQTTYDHGAYLPVNTMVNDVENSAGVLMLDPAVQYSVTCPAIQETRLPDGRLKVIANLRNRENRRIQVQVNCEFKDTQGFPSEDASPFVNTILDENAQQSVSFTSMNDKAIRYTVHVRQAR
jgi:uncharacterized protein (DUF2141 family)